MAADQVSVKVAGLQMTLIQLKNSTTTVRAASIPAVKAAGEALKKQVVKYTSLQDHTLAQLAAMDHPYARRHGRIRVHHRKPWQVHKQTGRGLAALRGYLSMSYPPSVGPTPTYTVTYDYNRAPHMKDVILGTRVMLPRDVLWQTALDPITQREMMRRVVYVLGKVLRTKLGIRFGPPPGAGRFGPTPGAGGGLAV